MKLVRRIKCTKAHSPEAKPDLNIEVDTIYVELFDNIGQFYKEGEAPDIIGMSDLELSWYDDMGEWRNYFEIVNVVPCAKTEYYTMSKFHYNQERKNLEVEINNMLKRYNDIEKFYEENDSAIKD